VRNKLSLRDGLEAGGAPLMWERTVREVLPTIRYLVPSWSRVLEVGYGDGLLTCYLCRELGWRMVGLEVDRESQRVAEKHAGQYGLSDRIEFRCCAPEETQQHCGQYDAVFIKTVLYHSQSLEEYGRWLDWIISVLRPGGVFINFESGRANGLTQCYRRLRQRSYTDLCLYKSDIEALYVSRFEIIDRRYYGGWSQFLAPVSSLYSLGSRIEERLRPCHADNSFVVSIVARHSG
jgi:protein-L-isoaspartate O-methyltransferase